MRARALLEPKTPRGARGGERGGKIPLHSPVIGPNVGRQGPLQERGDSGFVCHPRGCGGGGLQPPPQERIAAVGSPLQCRGRQRDPTGYVMWPLQRIGPRRDALHPRCYARGSTASINTGARSKDAMWARAGRALMPWPNSQTAGAHIRRVQQRPSHQQVRLRRLRLRPRR